VLISDMLAKLAKSAQAVPAKRKSYHHTPTKMWECLWYRFFYV